MTLDNIKLPEPEAPYYTTDAFTDYAIRFVGEQKDDKPFFLYLAFNAPHWPLQAKEEDIQKFTKIYREKGWNEIREARRKRMAKVGNYRLEYRIRRMGKPELGRTDGERKR